KGARVGLHPGPPVTVTELRFEIRAAARSMRGNHATRRFLCYIFRCNGVTGDRTMMLVRLLAAFLAATVTLASAQQWPPKPEPLGDEIYQPSLGQPGKDVVWIPTPDGLVIRMLTEAR